jgi:hypothetical protein
MKFAGLLVHEVVFYLKKNIMLYLFLIYLLNGSLG